MLPLSKILADPVVVECVILRRFANLIKAGYGGCHDSYVLD